MDFSHLTSQFYKDGLGLKLEVSTLAQPDGPVFWAELKKQKELEHFGQWANLNLLFYACLNIFCVFFC